MVDSDFYLNGYLGSAISEAAFPGAAAEAARILEHFKCTYRVDGGEQAQKLAICAMAEVLCSHAKRRGGISSTSVGSVSVHYDGSDAGDKVLSRQLYRSAATYLEIYRGVEG